MNKRSAIDINMVNARKSLRQHIFTSLSRVRALKICWFTWHHQTLQINV